MGDGQKSVLRVGFEPRLRLAFQGAKISSDDANQVRLQLHVLAYNTFRGLGNFL